jgi:xanthine dehydrogenase YagT iron-sulfur-binding subunit
MKTHPISLTVNGRAVGPIEIPEGLSMNDFLREYLNLTGTKFGCGVGACSACVVVVDNADGTSNTVHTCITGADFFAGKRVRTIEGVAQDGKPTAVQAAFLDHFAFQCGYCTPGFVNAATVLVERLERSPVARADLEAKISEALDPHLCRCTGYVRYFEAVRKLVLETPGLVR